MSKVKRKLKKIKESNIIKSIESGNPRREEIGKICGYIKDNFIKDTDYFCLEESSGNKIYLYHNGEDVFYKTKDMNKKIILIEDIEFALSILEGAINNEYIR